MEINKEIIDNDKKTYPESPRTIETIVQLFDSFGVTRIYLNDHNSINQANHLGRGACASVYKSKYRGKIVSIKKMELYKDSPFLILSLYYILSQIAINDIIISQCLSSINFPTIQKIYGYDIMYQRNKIYLLLIKKYYDCELLEFLQSDEFNNISDKHKQHLLSNIILHVLLTFKYIFIEQFNGRYADATLRNILIQRTDEQYVQYGNIKLRLLGYKPVIIDFGHSNIVFKNKFIMRTNWRSEDLSRSIAHQLQNQPNDKSFDLFNFFHYLYLESFGNYNLKESLLKESNNKTISSNWMFITFLNLIYDIGFTKLDRPINDEYYKPNCLPLDDFLNTKIVKNYLENSYFLE